MIAALVVLAVVSLPALMHAQPTECATLDLPTGQAMNASLSATDCRVRDLLGSGANQAYAKRFRLTVTERTVMTFTLNSAEFDTFLYIYTPQLRLLGSNDNANGQTTDSRVAIHLTPGTYLIFAAAARIDLTGAFRLTATPSAPRECPTLDLAPDGAVEGSFSGSSCRLIDLNPLSTNETFITFYRVVMPREAVLSLRLATAVPRISTLLTTPDLFVFRGETRLTVSLPAGTMLLSLSAAAEGSYSVQAGIEDLRECPVTDIEATSDTAATLENTGCRFLDFFRPSSNPAPLQLYRFRLDAARVTQLDQSSTVIDSLLGLVSSQGRVLALNDDISAQNLDSRILMHLPAGTYRVAASSVAEDQLGAFNLKLSGEAPRACTMPELQGETRDGALSASTDCRVIDLLPFSSNVQPATAFRVNATAPGIVSISGRLQPAAGGVLSMVTPDGGEAFRRSPDTAGNVVLDLRVNAGDHKLMWYSTNAARPAFTLRATQAPLPTCAATDVAPTDAVSGELTAADCRGLDLIPYLLVNGRAKAFNFKLPAAGLTRVAVDSSDFVPFLGVITAEARPVGLVGGNAPGPLSLTGNLPAGDYRIVVGSLTNANGAFRLQTLVQTEATPPASRIMPVQRIDGAVEAGEAETMDVLNPVNPNKARRLY